jgi:hypothetical protein
MVLGWPGCLKAVAATALLVEEATKMTGSAAGSSYLPHQIRVTLELKPPVGHEDQWNRIEDPDMKPHNYNQFVFDQGAKNIQWIKSSLLNKNCWENWLAVCKKQKLDPCISP